MRSAFRLWPMLAIPAACLQWRGDYLAQEFEALVSTERAFAHASVTSSTRAAFLEFLAEDAILFEAGPVDGRELWEVRPETDAVLSWRPEIAGIADSGDMGYTSGPWEWRARADTAPAAWGHFISVWLSDSTSTWRVAADGGITHGPVELGAARAVTRVGDSPEFPVRIGDVDISVEQAELSDVDAEYSRMVAESGFTESLNRFVDRTARFFRSGTLPIVGIASIAESAQVADAVWSEWEQRGVVVSRAADMGFTYGVVNGAPEHDASGQRRPASYYRIWRQHATTVWQVVVDVLIPYPPTDQ